MKNYTKYMACVAATILLGGCAAIATTISQPSVSLNNVEIGSVDFSKQTFVLGFDVSNPNPFPLPIKSVSYGVKLDNQRFASGETVGSITVPANSDSQFAISVDLDLLRTAPQLLYTLRDGVTNGLSYELNGKLGIDIPLVDPIAFKTSGEIRVGTGDIHSHNGKR
ncbi:MAG: LEA type 2 family protein [Woeseiaceae bacterium]